MRLLVFGAHYEPDLGPSAPLYTMLCENLVKLGHQLTMITMVPHYPSGQVSPEYRGKLLWNSTENGVEVIRIGLPSVDRSKLPQRLLQYLIYQLGTTLSGLGKQYDIVFAGSSSLSAFLPFTVLVTLRRKPAIYGVYDVYPNVGIKLGIFRSKLIIDLVTKMERSCLDNATLVRIISESFRADLHALGVPDEKMVRGYDWVDTDLIRPLSRENSFSVEYGLSGKFVVMYAGNIGLSQGLVHVLTTAEILLDDNDICFVFVGDGASREQLAVKAEQKQLRNVRFIPFQPRQRLPEVLASADISLVTLQHGIGKDSLPSKIYSILASGRPLIASVDEGSEAWNLIKQADAGLCITPENPSALATAILTLKNDPAKREYYGHMGRLWAEQNHSPLAGAKNVEQLLLRALDISKHKNR